MPLVVNVGPRADGTIPEIMVDRLRGIGGSANLLADVAQQFAGDR